MVPKGPLVYNDNLSTVTELYPKDINDEDGNPIYLDIDGDGNTSPIANINDDGLVFYLDPDIAIEAISNYDTSFETIAKVLNLTLSDSDSNITLVMYVS